MGIKPMLDSWTAVAGGDVGWGREICKLGKTNSHTLLPNFSSQLNKIENSLSLTLFKFFSYFFYFAFINRPLTISILYKQLLRDMLHLSNLFLWSLFCSSNNMYVSHGRLFVTPNSYVSKVKVQNLEFCSSPSHKEMLVLTFLRFTFYIFW